MGIQEEQLQQEPTKPEDDSPEPTIISRRQAELDEANDRLKCTAQVLSTQSRTLHLIEVDDLLTAKFSSHLVVELLVRMEIVPRIRDEDQTAADDQCDAKPSD